MPSPAALAPHPYAALLCDAPGADGAVQRQRRRRAAILATARRLLAEGEAGFTLPRVAAASGVTVQTLRNSFGRRDELIVSAVDEHTSAVWRALSAVSAGPLAFLHLAELYGHCAAATPEFLRATVTSAVADVGALARLQRHGSAIKAGHLRRMNAEGLLRERVDAAALAAQVTRLNTFTMYEWSAGGDAAELCDELAAGNRRLLLGAVRPRLAPAIEAWAPAGA